MRNEFAYTKKNVGVFNNNPHTALMHTYTQVHKRKKTSMYG